MHLTSLDDSGRNFYAWNYASALMKEDFRDEVMRMAWKHRPKASVSLRKFATQAFLGAIRVKGFRAKSTRILRLAYTTVREGLLHSMMVDADVASAIIGLWADSQRDVVNHIHEAALIAGFNMREGWTPEIAHKGFYSITVIDEFYDFACDLDEEEPQQWHNCLSALWLSSAFVAPEYVLEESKPVAQSEASPVDDEIPVESSKPQPIANDVPVADEEAIVDDRADELSASDLNLSIIDDTLSEYLKQVKRDRNITTQLCSDLLKDIKSSATDNAIERTVDLHAQLQQWQAAQAALYSLEMQVAVFLSDELRERPDLGTSIALDDLDMTDLSASDIERVAKEFIETVVAIAAYDTQKDSTLRTCQQLLDDITTLVQQMDNPELHLTDLPDMGSQDTVILQTARQWETKLRNRKKQIEDEIQSLRETLINQINIQIDNLRKRGVDPEQVNLGDNPDLSFKDIERKTLPILRTLRFILQTRMDDWIQQHTQDDRETAENVREHYSAETLTKLLEHLATQQRDVESLLILLCAYAVQDAKFDLTLSDAVVNSVLQGLQVLSDDSRGFALLNQLAPVLLLNQWQCDGNFGQARLSLMLLGAEYEPYRMPAGTLWQANIQQWSYSDMPEWTRLWNVELFTDQRTDICGWRRLSDQYCDGETCRKRSLAERKWALCSP
ncbi:MAG: hypothetical protein Q9P01_17850 [Anaerolineae bacterium]|nr:hypothetical protein [Anaerolineae bacterium]